MHATMLPLVSLGLCGLALAQDCPDYVDYAAERHPPFSSGIYEYPYQRPAGECHTHKVDEVEEIIGKGMNDTIADRDLHRLFENTWPKTLDTTLAFIITGDIDAMWMRDSSNQLQSYKLLLPNDQIARLFRGAINLQGRYMRQSPHCNAFQPPPESGIPPTLDNAEGDVVSPPYDPEFVFECKYEIDSLAAFFQLSWDYYEATDDADFFRKFGWKDAVRTILDTANDMKQGTYADDGRVLPSPYTWQRKATSASETVANHGTGAPVKGNIGLVRSFFRPSDDSCIYQYFIPGNMMFARYVKAAAEIMNTIDEGMAKEMRGVAEGIEQGIQEHAVVKHPKFGDVYAFEIDGFGSFNLMDDANLPSLLSIPHLGYLPVDDPVYQNTRAFVLSNMNPYYAYGGPHLGPGNGWPMGVITQILTTEDDEEISSSIRMLMDSTSGLGLMHETVNSHDDSQWTRPWFAWANGLFGQMILDLADREPDLLKASFHK
ncbi:uncharacterized protein F5Z01DRAFT_686504 [Emericellopsis atlantica]|uniref:Meiotically up-regulated gene 157 protein n=1 Tax=Emericellopsis atlantica TaxID=2614577 RepID=A0A9P7ZM40_9HYPO|nr:uncharacterized protein F5Z01DRAFT_686504 [Emericellopsis atlantica]KAG9254644.1 hypothetical protein F5Z01DRAFT_686504 [Emericellopsis atlantica]